MGVRVVAGTAHPALAGAVAATLGAVSVECEPMCFPDGELRPVVGHVRGGDVYVVQPTGPAVNECVIELLLLLDACRRGGADRITAVVPYFGYARQDRRTRSGQPVGARVMAEALAAAGADRMLVVDPHTAALEAMCGIPVDMLTAVPVLAGALAQETAETAVVVSPDLGAVKLAEHYAGRLRRPVAVVRKTRVSGMSVHAEELVGDVAGRPAVIVDDMISTGGTVEAAVQVLLGHGAAPDITVAATHGLLAGPARERLGHLPIRRLYVTNTLAVDATPELPLQVRSVASLLADAINRLHHSEPLDSLLMRT
ncbi:ribose-phosphate diphosphokinase [Streptomyces sp. ET3-23]|uniref:ribose-phosphate diphosphokinase n=1 Tax=Streptomyces sp. ET3-23 TaxID=2885643 RepID=UPI001D108D8B|nr:ribose-phosphate diphosphokinase [Streptomyces sp. ET3-23]MCC2274408.1 ribose-phosphate diphosphokinase [Streptomyces sp. ET3-23]